MQLVRSLKGTDFPVYYVGTVPAECMHEGLMIINTQRQRRVAHAIVHQEFLDSRVKVYCYDYLIVL